MVQVLSPICEDYFLNYSYGFRSNILKYLGIIFLKKSQKDLARLTSYCGNRYYLVTKSHTPFAKKKSS